MAAEISVRGAPLQANLSVAERAMLAAWKDDLTIAYICAVAAAVALGRLRAFVAKSA
jgi:hypothetical protein